VGRRLLKEAQADAAQLDQQRRAAEYAMWRGMALVSARNVVQMVCPPTSLMCPLDPRF